jgi:thymidylate synthase (FAD)
MEYRTDSKVSPFLQVGSDIHIAIAAWQSTDLNPEGKRERNPEKTLNYLVKHRHGSPFEEGYLSVNVECPIFVAREWMRHRTQSFSEMSARYVKLLPQFWLPSDVRPLRNVGTSARPVLGHGPDPLGDYDATYTKLIRAYRAAWEVYEELEGDGIAREVARAALPVGIYTKFNARFNPRSLMHFLSLRTHEPDALFISYPQAEIEQPARELERMLEEHWPLTYKAFQQNKRVSP